MCFTTLLNLVVFLSSGVQCPLDHLMYSVCSYADASRLFVCLHRPLAYIIEINKTAECYAVLFGGVVFRWIKSSATARTVASVSRDGNVAARLHFEALA